MRFNSVVIFHYTHFPACIVFLLRNQQLSPLRLTIRIMWDQSKLTSNVRPTSLFKPVRRVYQRSTPPPEGSSLFQFNKRQLKDSLTVLLHHPRLFARKSQDGWCWNLLSKSVYANLAASQHHVTCSTGSRDIQHWVTWFCHARSLLLPGVLINVVVMEPWPAWRQLKNCTLTFTGIECYFSLSVTCCCANLRQLAGFYLRLAPVWGVFNGNICISWTSISVCVFVESRFNVSHAVLVES